MTTGPKPLLAGTLLALGVVTNCGCDPRTETAPSTITRRPNNSPDAVPTPDLSKPEKRPAGARWVATGNNGCKPGNGYEFICNDNKLVGYFYLLDPDGPDDLSSSVLTVDLKNAKRDGLMITCSMTLESHDGALHEDLTIQLAEQLEGDIGTRVHATVSAGPDRATQDLEFVRIE